MINVLKHLAGDAAHIQRLRPPLRLTVLIPTRRQVCWWASADGTPSSKDVTCLPTGVRKETHLVEFAQSWSGRRPTTLWQTWSFLWCWTVKNKLVIIKEHARNTGKLKKQQSARVARDYLSCFSENRFSSLHERSTTQLKSDEPPPQMLGDIYTILVDLQWYIDQYLIYFFVPLLICVLSDVCFIALW